MADVETQRSAPCRLPSLSAAKPEHKNEEIYELAVELTYPTPESLSGGGVALLNNVGCLVLLAAKHGVCKVGAMNLLMAVVVGVTLLFLVVGVKEEYRRWQATQAGRA